SDLAVQLKFGRLASIRTRERPINPIATFYKSRDEHWFIHNPRQGNKDWLAFAGIAGLGHLAEDERFATSRARRENSAILVAEFDKAFAAMDFEDIAEQLDAADLVWSPVQTPAQVAADPQVLASGAIVQVEDGQGGTYPAP